MRRFLVSGGVLVLLAVTSASLSSLAQARDWEMNATVIEACTCPMFCQCYFASKPAGHHEHGGAASRRAPTGSC
ncbi:MAG: hypothetical protein LC804_26565 [Acidobacteria bacterium]|nr:hypothetical protein [Acidobacteriota bacterium]